MRSKVQNTHQLIFTPKYRAPILVKPGRDRLCRYANGFFRKKECELFAANGVEDYLHFTFFLHQSIAVADIVRDLKRSLHNFIDRNVLFPLFDKWQERYSCFSYSYDARDAVCAYVRRQEAHHAHQREDYLTELRRLYEGQGLDFDERCLE